MAEKKIYPIEGTSALKAQTLNARTLGQAHIIDFDAVRYSRNNTRAYKAYKQPTLAMSIGQRLGIANLKELFMEGLQSTMQPTKQERVAFYGFAGATLAVGLLLIGLFM